MQRIETGNRAARTGKSRTTSEAVSSGSASNSDAQQNSTLKLNTHTMNISSLLSLGSSAAKNSAVKKAGRVARRSVLGLTLLGAVASAPAAVNLTGTPVSITSCLNGKTETATVFLTGTTTQVTQRIFSWMIPGDSFSVVEYSNGYDRFGLILSGNHTFTPSDALTITYGVETGTVFDGNHTLKASGPSLVHFVAQEPVFTLPILAPWLGFRLRRSV
jgi:hypothetical protein